MARSRNIKPGFFANDELAECDPLARLLFVGLWCFADRAGRIDDKPKKLKAGVLPYDDCNIENLLSQLENTGFIIRYAIDDSRYIQVVNFLKHQNPHIKEPESTIPAPDKHHTKTVPARLIPSSLIPDSLNLIPDPKGKDLSSKPDDSVMEVFRHWQKVMGTEKAIASPERISKIRARLKDYTVAQLKEAIDGCRKSDHHMGNNDRKKKYNDIELICRDCKHVDSFLQEPAEEENSLITGRGWAN